MVAGDKGMRVCSQRFKVIFIGLVLIFSFLSLQLVRLQLWLGADLEARAIKQQGHILTLDFPRGGIYDRNFVSLTGSQNQPVLAIFPTLVEDKGATARELAALFGGEFADLHSCLKRGQPFTLTVKRVFPGLAVFDTGSFPGVFLLQRAKRYGEMALAQHLIGYIQGENGGGVAGLERHYDSHLRKGQGLDLMAWVDANGSIIPDLGLQQVLRGTEGKGDLVLTLDARVQRIVEEVMDEKVRAGAVVVVQVRTGEIMALASRPNYCQDRIKEYLNNTDACLINRALRNYPPGSLFKIIVTAAALEEGLTQLDEDFYCGGFLEVGAEIFRCHRYQDGGHGPLDLTEAFAKSCNPIFISLAQRLGSVKLLNYAHRLGLGAAVLGLAEEMLGHLGPEAVYAGDLANISLGQGSILVTPLQIAQMTQAIANGGVYIPLQITRGDSPRGDAPTGRTVLSGTTVAALATALQRTVTDGTGTAAALSSWTSGGKTGTAETGLKDANGQAICHAWFAGFAPLQAPLMAVVVLVEEGGSGSQVAAPVFREILQRIIAEIPVAELKYN
ncbi:MAG: penicillin-binding protein 2 [Firmicutes bacterium]|nr:penicillin-binding protein 2 [Bacillota bacterium]